MKVINNRRDEIIDLLEASKNKSLTVKSLAESLDVSEMTIRRDLTVLENMGLIDKLHGSAELIENNNNTYDEENEQKMYLKDIVARQTAKYVEKNMTVFINTSTTALQTLNHLTDIPITLITNNLRVSSKKMNPNTTIILAGGEIRFPKEALVGDLSISILSNMTADIAIMGCSGISAEKGVTTNNIHESKINDLMINNAEFVIVVANYQKIGVDSNFSVSPIENIDVLITDIYADTEAIRQIEEKGVQVIMVE